jgi:LEA14-like dessication related protein
VRENGDIYLGQGAVREGNPRSLATSSLWLNDPQDSFVSRVTHPYTAVCKLLNAVAGIRNWMTRLLHLPLLLALLLLGFFSGCSAPLREPNITVKDITLESVSLRSLELGTELQFVNPNPVGITLTNVTFDVFFETGTGREYLGHGGRENLTLPKNQPTVYKVPVEIDNLQALKALAVLVREGSLPLVVNGTAAVDLKVTTVKIPFEKRKVVG